MLQSCIHIHLCPFSLSLSLPTYLFFCQIFRDFEHFSFRDVAVVILVEHLEGQLGLGIDTLLPGLNIVRQGQLHTIM